MAVGCGLRMAYAGLVPRTYTWLETSFFFLVEDRCVKQEMKMSLIFLADSVAVGLLSH